MFAEDSYKLGYLHKTYGIKGELIIRTNLEFSDQTIIKWESVFIEIDGILVPFFIEQIKRKSDIELSIKLEDIDDEIKAKDYLCLDLYIDKKNIPKQNNETPFFDWLGSRLIDKTNGEVGTITEILNYPGQDMLKIETTENQEIIIPAIKDWLVSIDKESKRIIVDLPEGLLDLNQIENQLF